MRIDSLADQLGQAVVQQLLAKYTTVEEYLLSKCHELSQSNPLPQLGHELVAAEAVLDQFLSWHLAPPAVSALALHDQLRDELRILPTGCDGLDTLLGNGLREGCVVEFAGESSAGKTQVCHMAAAATALRAEGVVYVDTTNAMSPARLLQAAEAMQAGTNTSEVLRCVHVARPHNIYELFDVLCEVNARCESLPQSTGHTQPGPGLPATPARPLVPRPCLLIVDSLSAVVSPVVGNPKHSQGFTLLACIGRLLRQLADTHRLAVVVTNHMVAARGGSEQEREREASSRSGSGLRVLVPALGEVWRSQVHTRLVLQLAPGSGPEGPRQAVLAASSISVAGASAWFTITAAGLQDYEPRLTSPAAV